MFTIVNSQISSVLRFIAECLRFDKNDIKCNNVAVRGAKKRNSQFKYHAEKQSINRHFTRKSLNPYLGSDVQKYATAHALSWRHGRVKQQKSKTVDS